MCDVERPPPIVLHCGSSMCRAGFAEEDQPRWALSLILLGEQLHNIETFSEGQCSPLLLVGPFPILVRLEAQGKTLMWETRRGLREEVSSTHGVQVLWRVVLWWTGTEWRRSGITSFTMSCVSILRTSLYSSLSPLWTQDQRGRELQRSHLRKIHPFSGDVWNLWRSLSLPGEQSNTGTC